jgi:hypothetical protein
MIFHKIKKKDDIKDIDIYNYIDNEIKKINECAKLTKSN